MQDGRDAKGAQVGLADRGWGVGLRGLKLDRVSEELGECSLRELRRRSDVRPVVVDVLGCDEPVTFDGELASANAEGLACGLERVAPVGKRIDKGSKI